MNGRPLKYLSGNQEVKVLDLIPVDGRCKRFSVLKGECKKQDISYRLLLKELKRLEDAGTIIRDAVKAERGAGTCYRRSVFPHGADISGYNRIFSDLLGQLKKAVDDTSTEEGKAVMASQGVLTALWVLQLTIYDELIEYMRTPDKGKAVKRLDSVLMDFIFPMIKRTTELAALPGACDTRAALAMDKLFVDNMKQWLDVWRSVKAPEEKLDIQEAQRRIAEIKRQAGIKD